MTSKTRVVVIGAGLAGVTLARRLGELGTPALTLGDEEHRPYNRVLLAEVLAGRYGPEVIALPAPAGLLRGRVTGIDRAGRTVRCADGSVIAYDTLVLATGSNAVLPPLRGLFTPDHELPEGVHAFRTMDDCLGLSKAVRPGVRAVVIGGGLLGVSAARALAVRGAQVVLAQQSERLMERQLDPAASALVRRHLEGLGVEVHTECRVRDVRSVGGAVRSVEMGDGYALGADLVVLACGCGRGPGWRGRRGWRSAKASSSTTSCAPPTRTSARSATAPSTRTTSTAWPRPPSNRPGCWPNCSRRAGPPPGTTPAPAH